ncbi:MAG: archaetidylserine decarboxylase [Chlamydia sp.]
MAAPHSLSIVDSRSKLPFSEKIWGESLLGLLYSGNSSCSARSLIRSTIAKSPWISRLWGAYNDLSYTKKGIAPFCTTYQIDEREFEKPIAEYRSFNDFFIRKLRSEVRPIDKDEHSVIAPADARYTFIPNIDKEMPFTVKGSIFNLESFFQSKEEASLYYGGVMVIARLCPTDCHRYVFPTSGAVSKSAREISGNLYSVSPIATSRFPEIWWKNKRVLTIINLFSNASYAMFEVGATNCGTIVHTFSPNSRIEKGEEKGYFKLGGSAIILIFPKGLVELDSALLALQREFNSEVYCQYGQRLGTFNFL